MAKPNHDAVIPLPRELNPYSLSKSLSAIVWTWTMFYGAIAGVAWAWSSALPIWATALATVGFCLLGGYGMLNMGFMGHDGFHFSLHKNRVTSCWMGMLASGPIALSVTGFAISHWNHHKHTNGPQDPDVQIFGKFKTLASRLLLARPYAFYIYMRNSLLLARGRALPYPYSFPLPEATMRSLARSNFLINGVWLAGHVVGFILFPAFFIGYALVYATGSMVSGLSPYIEHNGTLFGRGIDTRTSTGWWWDVLTLQNNYHLEHHLYPTIPAYNLKAVYRYLASQGYYDKPRFTTDGIRDAYAIAGSQYQYPCFEG